MVERYEGFLLETDTPGYHPEGRPWYGSREGEHDAPYVRADGTLTGDYRDERTCFATADAVVAEYRGYEVSVEHPGFKPADRPYYAFCPGPDRPSFVRADGTASDDPDDPATCFATADAVRAAIDLHLDGGPEAAAVPTPRASGLAFYWGWLAGLWTGLAVLLIKKVLS